MVNEVTLSVCDNCDAVGYECDLCIACDAPMQKVVFVRKASQLTPVAGDGACVSTAGKFQRHWFGPKSKCQRCGQLRA